MGRDLQLELRTLHGAAKYLRAYPSKACSEYGQGICDVINAKSAHLRGGGLKPEGGAPPGGNPGGKPGAPGNPAGGGKAPPNPGGAAIAKLEDKSKM